jgi:hypothetical protein
VTDEQTRRYVNYSIAARRDRQRFALAVARSFAAKLAAAAIAGFASRCGALGLEHAARWAQRRARRLRLCGAWLVRCCCDCGCNTPLVRVSGTRWLGLCLCGAAVAWEAPPDFLNDDRKG